MNPKAQRIAIAEACEWTRKEAERGFKTIKVEEYGMVFNKISDHLPDYLNDLNAMHEAVMAQPPDTRLLFRKELQYMIAPRTRPGPVSGIVLMCREDYDLWFHATAAQRAEAFLRTLGLWEDNK